MFLLFAHLSYGLEKPIRIMSLAGTPLYEKRVGGLKFDPLGVSMPNSGLEVYEMNMRRAALVPAVVRELQRRLFDPVA